MKPLLPFQAGPSADVVAPFCVDGAFVEDFFMEDRVAALAETSLSRYVAVVAMTPSGSSPMHLTVVTPGGFTSPADLGWMDGADYAWRPELSDQANAAAWDAAGRPSKNAQGVWVDGGVPPEFLVYARMHVDERAAKYPNGSPKQLARRAAGVGGESPGRKKRPK